MLDDVLSAGYLIRKKKEEIIWFIKKERGIEFSPDIENANGIIIGYGNEENVFVVRLAATEEKIGEFVFSEDEITRIT